MLPAIGSTMTAAIRSVLAAKSAWTDARSLYDATSVSADAPRVTPGLSGVPKVSAPEPACTRNASAWP